MSKNNTDVDILLKSIKSRILNNVHIVEYGDDRDIELNIDDCLNLIKNDLDNYHITKKNNIDIKINNFEI
jgi:hypothetical protein